MCCGWPNNRHLHMHTRRHSLTLLRGAEEPCMRCDVCDHITAEWWVNTAWPRLRSAHTPDGSACCGGEVNSFIALCQKLTRSNFIHLFRNSHHSKVPFIYFYAGFSPVSHSLIDFALCTFWLLLTDWKKACIKPFYDDAFLFGIIIFSFSSKT